MSWFLARLSKGPAFSEEIPWPEGIDAFIPLAKHILHGDYVAPEKKSILLYWHKMNSPRRNPLVWYDPGGNRRCSIHLDPWITALKTESYRPEHRKPLMAKIPLSYHNIPEKIRFAVISGILRLKHHMKLDRHRFPVTPFNGGCEILLKSCENLWAPALKVPLVVLTHDIETRFGFQWIEQILCIEEHFGFRSLWNVIPRRYAIDSRTLNTLLDRGHEIGLHGIEHNSREAFLRDDELRLEFNRLRPFIEEFNIKGYRSPAWYRTRKMFEVLSEYFSYDLSSLDTDLICPGGNGGVGLMRPFRFDTGLAEFPCSLPFESPLYWGILPESLLDYWRPKIKFIHANKGMLLITTHPDPNYLGNATMLSAYADLLGYIADSSWKASLPRDIVETCI